MVIVERNAFGGATTCERPFSTRVTSFSKKSNDATTWLDAGISAERALLGAMPKRKDRPWAPTKVGSGTGHVAFKSTATPASTANPMC